MRKRPYFKMESAMTAILRDASGKMHHGIPFDPPLIIHCMFRWRDCAKHVSICTCKGYGNIFLSLRNLKGVLCVFDFSTWK